MSDKRLHILRADILASFEKMARKEGTPFDPNMDFNTLDLCNRLYDETFGQRRINIDYDPESTLSLNGFTKEIGLEPDTTSLLAIFVNEQSVNAGHLWAICKSWLHDGMDEETALRSEAK